MKIRWNFLDFTIYPKLLLTFLLVIVPMYVLSLLINHSGQKNVQSQISILMSYRVENYLNSFETEIERIDNLEREYISDYDLQNLSNIAPAMSPFDKSLAILRVQDKLRLLKDSSLFVSTVEAFIPLLGGNNH